MMNILINIINIIIYQFLTILLLAFVIVNNKYIIAFSVYQIL